MILESARLRVEVRPEAGGTIASVRDRASGAEVLAQVPWDRAGPPTHAAPDEGAWLSRWAGGWPILFPNGGDACLDAGVAHGFHGEGSVAPWRVLEAGPGHAVLARRFLTAPARMVRWLRVEGARLLVEEEIVAEAPCEAIWGQHVTLGGDLLAGPVRIATSARRAAGSADYAPPESPLRPGAPGFWPLLPGRDGPVDLSRPGPGWSALACLSEFAPVPWVEVAPERGPAVRLDWTPESWPLAWLWIETGGERGAPWFGRGRCLGVEPCTTWPATGLARARAAGGWLLSLRPGAPRRGRITLSVT